MHYIMIKNMLLAMLSMTTVTAFAQDLNKYRGSIQARVSMKEHASCVMS